MRRHTSCWTARVAHPAIAMPVMFTTSWRALPHTSSKSPKVSPRATLPAAGTVVTEMKTPESPPDLRARE